jgi:hypothetical protein
MAGVVGTAGGITSLISYPALLAVGLSPLQASVTNIVALVACWPGSALTSGPELTGRSRWLFGWGFVAGTGGLVGSVLLISTPPGAFGEIVPYLLVFAALSLVAQPRLSSWRERHHVRATQLVVPCGLVLASVYNGYFGAGSGVITTALLLVTVEPEMAKANALKNMLIGVATVVSAVTLVALGHVDWSAALALGVGSFFGSTVGPLVARRIPAGLLRWLVALAGLGLAVRLWVSPL